MWETTATLRLLGGARGAGAPTGGGEGRGHIVSPRAQLAISVNEVVIFSSALVLSWEWYERDPWLHWNVNRKSRAPDRSVPVVSSDNLE